MADSENDGIRRHPLDEIIDWEEDPGCVSDGRADLQPYPPVHPIDERVGWEEYRGEGGDHG